MPARSAGILIYRQPAEGTEVLLVHPGGPFWRNKDVGAWQIPKGLVEPGEDDEAAARREAGEELGIQLDGPLTPLGEIRQAGGKTVVAYAAERDVDPAGIVSNTVEIDWLRAAPASSSSPRSTRRGGSTSPRPAVMSSPARVRCSTG